MRTPLLRYITLLSLCILLSFAGRAAAADWAENFGGLTGASVYNQATATDAAGNTYIAGYFDGATLTLGSITLTRIGTKDAFVAKIDPSGTVLWAKNFGGSGAEAYGWGISVDGSGNVYLGGNFQYGNLTTPALAKVGNSDAFALKLDSTGATTWAKNFGGSGAIVFAKGIAVDGSGNVYIEGDFTGANLTTPVLTAIGTRDVFALKLSSSGDTTWARNFGGSGAYAYGQGIRVDGSGNVYLGGCFNTANLTTPALAKIGSQDAFALKLDSTGAITWARNFGGSGASAFGNAIAVDGSGNIYLGGYIQGTNLTTPALTKIGTSDAFALKLDSSGATTWARNFGGSGASTYGQGIAVDGSGNVYLEGYFQSANLTTPALTKIGTSDAFTLKLDSAGTTSWAKNFGGSGAYAYGYNIAVDGSGDVYLGGYFYNANLTNPTLIKIGTQDAFALKLDSTGAITWAKNFVSTAPGITRGFATATDASGNTYIAGIFSSASLALGSVTLTRIGSQDAFVAKLDPLGTVLWAKNFGGSGANASGRSIAVDGSGYVYLGGDFNTANLTTPVLTKIGTSDAFTLKLDSAGTTTWAKNFGGSGANTGGYGIAVDGSGNVYLGGSFSYANLITPTLTKIGNVDAFTIKLSSLGAITWARNFGGSGASASGNAIAVDGSGNVYLGGDLMNANLSTPVMTRIGNYDAFALKLSSTGSTTWAKNFGGSGANTYGKGIAVDTSGSVYLVGDVIGSLTNPALTMIGFQDGFAFKLDSSGATTWAKNFGGSGASAYGQGIAVDGSGNVYLGGYFTFANLTTPALAKIGSQDAFAFKLNSSGATTWAKNFGGSGATAYGQGIAVDGFGNVHTVGYFQNANLTTPTLTKIGTTDAFITVNRANNAPTAAILSAPIMTVEMVAGSPLAALNASPSTDPDTAYGDAIVSYSWDLNNDSTFGDATGVNPSLTWAQQQGFGLASLGNHTVNVRVTDTFGAFSTASVTLRYVDATPPSVTPSLTAGTYNGSQSVTLTCSDAGSGCATVLYCLGSSCTPSTSYTGTIAINSSTTLKWQASDSSGNSATGQAAYTINLPPIVSTDSASTITATTATLGGTVNDNGTTTTVNFQYGQDTNYGSAAPGSNVSAGSGATDVMANLTGLTCATTYHYRVVGQNTAGTTFGSDTTFTTSLCPQSISFASPTLSKTYGDADFGSAATTPSPLAVSYDSSDPTVATIDPASGLIHIKAAGTSTLTAYLAGDDNHLPATATTILTVNRAPLTVGAKDTSRSYGTPNPTFVPTYSGFVNGEDAKVLQGTPDLTTIATSNSPTGSYLIDVSQGTLVEANYHYTFGTGTLAIDLASQTITFNPLAAKTYGDPTFDLTVTGGASGNPVTFVSSDPTVATVNGTTVTIIGKGTTFITASQNGIDNEYASASAQQTLTVNPATLTVSAKDASRPYNNPNPPFAPTFNGFVYGDTAAVLTGQPDISTLAALTSPVGSYPVTVGQGTLQAANYIFSFAPATLGINVASQNITFDALAAKAYGDQAFDLSAIGGGSDNPVSFASSNPAVATITGTTVTITASQNGNSNYASTSTQQSLTVNKAALLVSAQPANRPYNSANPAFTPSYSGFAYSDTAAVLQGVPDLATAANLASPVGDYPITVAAGNLFSTNYDFTFTPGTLAIGQAYPEITWANPESVTYGTMLSGTQLNAGTNVPGTYAYTPDVGTILNAGGNQSLSVTFRPTDSTNYATANKTVYLSVLKATPTITWANPADITYGTPLSGTQLNAGANVPGTISYNQPAGTVLSAGANQTLTAYLVPTDQTNYVMFSKDVTINVTKAPLTVTANNVSRAYNTTNPTLTYTIIGYVNNDTAAVVSGTPDITTTADLNSTAGNYPITVSLGTLQAANYNFTFVNGTLTVLPLTYQLQVTLNGTGSGSINSIPAGFTCTSGTCFATYTVGDSVNLTATPSSDSTFAGWSGACSGTGTCNITSISADRTVSATFTRSVLAMANGHGYSSLQLAYDLVADGSIIGILEGGHSDFFAIRPVTITIRGGFNVDYSSNLGESVIQGSMTIQNGRVNVQNVKIR